jgi:hypothetical protein
MFALAGAATVTNKIRLITDRELALPDFLSGTRWDGGHDSGQLKCSLLRRVFCYRRLASGAASLATRGPVMRSRQAAACRKTEWGIRADKRKHLGRHRMAVLSL